MKFKITFEIDATGTSYEIKDKDDEVPAVLQNLSSWLNELHFRFLEEKFDNLLRLAESKTESEKLTAEAIIKHNNEECQMAKQLFNNYTVKATMTDGKKFTFTHKEPGYKETMTFH